MPMRVALLLALGLTPAFAARPITPPAPEFPASGAWINAKPLTLKDLRNRRVVLVAFINTTNINSLRSLAILKEWHERYALEGLSIIGVHTPDFDFQKDPLFVKAALKRFGVPFPVVVDSSRSIWRNYSNEGWPAFYLVDHKGRLVFDHLGEGGYREFEGEIRLALEDAGYEPPEVAALAADPKSRDCGDMTAEVSVGLRRGKVRDLSKSPRERISYILAVRDGEATTTGSWNAEPDALRLKGDNADHSSAMQLIYRGSQGFAVLAPQKGSAVFYVRQDDLWLHSGNAGSDIRFDDDGRSFIEADGARLYHLTQNPNDSMHELSLIPLKPGAAVYGFSFSDRCLTSALPTP